jgi:chromosome segregation ATPase
MNFSYPGDNLHLENHSLGEESFWPSFTDIMMVIVMVFLLVTVAVILNNWTLIANLKQSIKAQQVASHLAEEAQVENMGLDAKLTAVQHQLAAAQQATKDEHQKLLDTLARLAKTEQMVNELSSTTEQQKTQLAEIENNLSDTKTSLATAQQMLQEKDQLLNEKIEALKQSKSNAAAQLTALTMLQKDRTKLETRLITVQKEQQALQQQLAQATEGLNSAKISSNDARAELQLLQKDKREQSEALERLEKENQRVIANIKAELTKKFEATNKILQSELESYKTKLTEAREQSAKTNKLLEEKDQMLVALQKERSKGESQLLSLKGEYDILDSKYQKLLRPARSSKGKYIATVSYKKVAGKKTIRLKTGSDASYKTVSDKELHKALEKLKEKHGTDLYVKIIIPNNSGLSYNEAWRFTSNLQKKYDYYFQPDSKRDAKKKED